MDVKFLFIHVVSFSCTAVKGPPNSRYLCPS